MRRQDIRYGDHTRHKLDIYSPRRTSKAVIVFLHGGSWKRGNKSTYAFIGRALRSMGYTAVMPNYRLYPEVRFPAFVEDVAMAIKWTQDNISNYNGDPQKIFIMGHSAGAHIAVLLGLDDKYLKGAGAPLSSIRGIIGLSGAYDFYPGPTLRPIFPNLDNDKSWRPIDQITNPTVPFLLIAGARDFTVASSNSVNLGESINTAGGRAAVKIYSWCEHMLILLPFFRGLGWIGTFRRDIKAFIKNNS